MRFLVLLLFVSCINCTGFLILSDQYKLNQIQPSESCTDQGCVTDQTTMVLEGPADAGGGLVIIFIRDTVLLFDYNITVSIKELFYGCSGFNPGKVGNGFIRVFPMCACFLGQDYCRICPETNKEGTDAFCFNQCGNVLDNTCPCAIIPFENPHKDSCCITGCNFNKGEWCGHLRKDPKVGEVAAVVQVFKISEGVTCGFLVDGFLHSLVAVYETPGKGQFPILTNEKVDVFNPDISSCKLSGVLILKYNRGITKIFDETVIRISDLTSQGGEGLAGTSVEPLITSNAVIMNTEKFFIGRSSIDPNNYALENILWCISNPFLKGTKDSPSCLGPLLFPRVNPNNITSVADLGKRVGPATDISSSIAFPCLATYKELGVGNADLKGEIVPDNLIEKKLGFSKFKVQEECEITCDSITDIFEKEQCKKECNLVNFGSPVGQIKMRIRITVNHGTVIGITQDQCVVTNFFPIDICDISEFGGICRIRQVTKSSKGRALWLSPQDSIKRTTEDCIDNGEVDLQIENPVTVGNFIEICVNMSIGTQLCRNLTFTFIMPTPVPIAPPQQPSPPPPFIVPPPSDGGLSFIQILLIIGAIIVGIIVLVVVGNVIGTIRTAV